MCRSAGAGCKRGVEAEERNLCGGSKAGERLPLCRDLESDVAFVDQSWFQTRLTEGYARSINIRTIASHSYGQEPTTFSLKFRQKTGNWIRLSFMFMSATTSFQRVDST